MEEKLQNLLVLNQEPNRNRYPAQWKKEGKKVVGLLCSCIPEEIVHATGMLPWRIMGTQRSSTPNADVYRPSHTCLYCNHVLESLLSGEYAHLDAVVATSWDQDLVRLWDVWKYLGKTPYTYIMHLPRSVSEIHQKQFAKEVFKFCEFVENVAGQKISSEALSHSIEIFNRSRELLHRVYGLRKRETPPLSGAEALGLTTAASLMPKELFIEQLDTLLPYLEKRKSSLKENRPRLLVSSDRLDNPDYLKVIVESGCLVAMVDLEAGSRYFWKFTEHSKSDSREGLLDALAKRYHSQPASPASMNWAEQVSQIAAWVKEFNIQGVLELPLKYSRPREMRVPYFRDSLSDLNIPMVSYEREYPLTNVGQLKTRVGAFVETLI
ncbi:MAG: 2-hydroxyacyl-CoA dehydratase [Candidatus Tectomicrobia bacterium]|uniref:2-hydroxyacyl-CoA dehydratase n=1 Tax=Tectimicrobiota bacterium TaxID=2528274 RepID=A0A933LQ16_UNCTE|nr:2-hydroxyacyl-CoA dehydratase [Candidatus Tectomicrobia bacterium]